VGALQPILTGAVLSLPLIGIYTVFAVGIVVIYRASRVINLAHGAFALVPAYIFLQLGGATPRWHILSDARVWRIPVGLAIDALVAIAGGVVLGLLTERFVVRRLRRQGPVAQTVGTVAVFGLAVAVAVKMYGSAPLAPPKGGGVLGFGLLPSGAIHVGNGSLRYASIIIALIGGVATLACLALFRFTDIGLAMRAAADNRRAASLMGVDPDRTTAMAWALGGGLAGLAGVLTGASNNIDAFVLGLQVLPAFVAVLIGGLDSLPGALIGSAIVGFVEAERPDIATIPGLGALNGPGTAQLIFMILAFILLATRGARLVGSNVRDAGLTAGPAPRTTATARRGGPAQGMLFTFLAIMLVLVPFLPFIPFSVVGDFINAWYYALAALSIVLLTGWVGQISLAQASLVGVGAFVTALATTRWHVPFPVSLLFGAAAGGVVAAFLGAVALRVRGLYLAIATLVFAWMADDYLFNQSWLGIIGGSADAHIPPIGTQGAIPYFDFASSQKLMYLLFLAAAAVVMYVLANLRESKTGRAFFAVRGSEVAAASLGIAVARYKLLAFAVAGVIAGVAGSLAAVYQESVSPTSFNILVSLLFLGIAVVGGVQSLGGAVLAGLLFAGLNEVFLRVGFLGGFLDIVSSALLLGVLLTYPGGLATTGSMLQRLWTRSEPLRAVAERRGRSAAIAVWEPMRTAVVRMRPVIAARLRPAREQLAQLRARLRARWERAVAHEPADALARLGGSRAEPAPATVAEPTATHGNGAARRAAPDTVDMMPASARTLTGRRHRPRLERGGGEALLRVSSASVQFGGLVAVNDASLEVRSGEIVGLIGPNGAGKTTLFNVISGLVVPTAGQVEILGADATAMSVHDRARLGVGRTFQAIQLFGELSVFENLLVATHLRNRSGFAGHCIAAAGAVASEVEMRRRVRRVLDFLELGDLAERTAGSLPFGQLRMIELARALVTGAQLLLLDEPASGLDVRESREFVDILLHVRDELRISMLLIEHDMATVIDASDYMYVLQQGSIIAQGVPRAVQRDAAVIEAYLGQPAGAHA
jgi:ABC-type branched-subunit amino acid transport system ATPase component/branched-subunit amino acid ABC-type transport system permease component